MKVIFDFKGSIFNQKGKIILDLPEDTTVIESLQKITSQIPSLQPLLFQEEKVRNDIVILVESLDVRAMNLLTLQLKDGQNITILPLAHGG